MIGKKYIVNNLTTLKAKNRPVKAANTIGRSFSLPSLSSNIESQHIDYDKGNNDNLSLETSEKRVQQIDKLVKPTHRLHNNMFGLWDYLI